MKKEDCDDEMNKYRDMVYKFVNRQWKICKESRREDIEFEDIEGEAWWVYAHCLRNFDAKKGMKFSTYLYQNLHSRLRDYCKVTMKPITSYPIFDEDDNGDTFEERLRAREESDITPFMAEAKEKLSYEAYKVLEYIVGWQWISEFHKTKPSLSQISSVTGFPSIVVNDAMSEIKMFWNDVGYKVA